MIEIYSKNALAQANGIVPLNTVALLKGSSTIPLGAGSIQINKCGIYLVLVSGDVTGSAAGNVTIQMEKNGVLQPQAVVTATAADATSQIPFSFSTLVQVPENNNINCPCSQATTISFRNTDIEATYNIDVKAIRI